MPINDGKRESLQEAARDDLFGVSQSFDDSAVQAIATEFATWAKVKVRRGSDAYFDLCKIVQRAHIEHFNIEL